LIQAIRSAAPFPPFPDEIRASKMFERANFVIADLPAATVTTVEHSTTGGVPPEVAESSDLSNQKKLMWGTPAGTSEQQEPKVNRDTPAPPPVKKYKWGL
jgi:hypothetical protein